MMIVYSYKKCSTCRNALKFLDEKGIEYELKEIVETAPSIEELRAMLKHKDGKIKALFNSSGMLYREMGLKDKIDSMTEEEALKLLSTHGKLVKRPFILGESFGFLGFKKDFETRLASVLEG